MNFEKNELAEIVDFNSVVTNPNNLQDDKLVNNLRDTNMYNDKLLSKKYRNLFITIPHTDIQYEVIHKEMVEGFKIKFVITCQELHEDGDTHIHQLILFEGQQQLKKIHNTIANYVDNGKRIKGSIDYQTPDNIAKVINYIRKDKKYIIEGDIDKYITKTGKAGAPTFNKNNNKSYQEQKDDIYTAIVKCIDDKNMTKEEVIKYMKDNNAREFVLHNDKIMKYIDDNFAPKYLKWDIPKPLKENVTLKPWQKELWDILQTPPKARRIIWIKGQYGIGKSFMLNYLETNYEYGVYNAGQSVSYDNVVYGYKEEGVICWDIPKTFDWKNLENPLCNIIEKFSDVGQTLTSKKYTGHKVAVTGHTLVFSNEEPPTGISHRDVKLIRTDYDITADGRIKVVNGDTTRYYKNLNEYENYLKNLMEE